MTQATDDGFFTDLENTKPYLKAAFEGFAGTGKTYTAAKIAVGLHARIQSTKPIAVFDTETAAKFLRPMFNEAGIRAIVKPSRSLADLKETMRRGREGAFDILLIDSISHVWENFVEAYRRDKNRTRLSFEDWGIIKPKWRLEFSDPFVRDPYHIMMTGRAAYEYEDEKDAEGRRSIVKSGIKMKVEGDTAYEPDMLVLMTVHEDILDDKKKVIYREATIIKDRADVIDGKTFRNPGYEQFSPAIELMMMNPVKRDLPPERDAADLLNELAQEFVNRYAAAQTKEQVEEITREVTAKREQLHGGRDRVAAARGEAMKRVASAA